MTAEEKMFQWLDRHFNESEDYRRSISVCALFLSEEFGLTLPQARAIRDKYLKIRKQEKKA